MYKRYCLQASVSSCLDQLRLQGEWQQRGVGVGVEVEVEVAALAEGRTMQGHGTGTRQHVCGAAGRPAPGGTSSASQEGGFLQSC